MAETMQYDSQQDEYVGVASDGRTVRVDAGEISESIDYAFKADGIDRHELWERDRVAYHAKIAEYEAIHLDPDEWAGMDEDNDQVHTEPAEAVN